MTAETGDLPSPEGFPDLDSALLDALSRDTPTAFALYRPDGVYLRVSGAFARLTGAAAGDLTGRRVTEVLPAAQAARVTAALDRVAATATPHTDGPTHYTPLTTATGTGVLAVVSTPPPHDGRWRAERLQTMAARFAGALSTAEVDAAVGELGRSIGANRAEIRLLKDAGPIIPWPNIPSPRADRALRGMPPDWPRTFVDAVRHGTPHFPPVPPAPGNDAWVVLPLHGSGPPLGVLRLAFPPERTFGAGDRVFLEALAGQCALAVERSRLYEREHRTAVALQRSLLPERLPAVRGVEFGFRYLPGAPDFEVGGDWYDVFQLLDGRVAVVVGDVIGKGLTAAAGMGRVRAALRALAFTDPEPTAVLTGLDRLFTATEDEESLTTLIYAVVDPATGTLDLADAGHLPVVIVSADGTSKIADTGPASTPLGVAERRTKQTIHLEPGDVVIGFSDGLVENRARGITEGLDLILDVARTTTGGLEALLSAILARLLEGQRRDDDVTILGVRVSESRRTGTGSGAGTGTGTGGAIAAPNGM